MQLYGKMDTEKLAEEINQCRQIITEINRFGITQRQILKIIELLAMELEDVNKMKKIAALIKTMYNTEDIIYQG